METRRKIGIKEKEKKIYSKHIKSSSRRIRSSITLNTNGSFFIIITNTLLLSAKIQKNIILNFRLYFPIYIRISIESEFCIFFSIRKSGVWCKYYIIFYDCKYYSDLLHRKGRSAKRKYTIECNPYRLFGNIIKSLLRWTQLSPLFIFY